MISRHKPLVALIGAVVVLTVAAWSSLIWYYIDTFGTQRSDNQTTWGAFGDYIGGVIGNPLTFFMFRHVGTATHPGLAPTIPLVIFALFHLKFAIITPALITGSFAERVRFTSYLLFMCLFSVFIYSPLAHWTWHPDGFLHKMGVLDFAGGTVVHINSGIAALVGAIILGRRVGYKKEPMPPHSLMMVMIGTGLLWFGWFGFNAGSNL